MVEVYLRLLEQGYYEVKFAFEGLADKNVWKRPAEGLLSVGELAGHLAYWEAVRLAGEGGEPDVFGIVSNGQGWRFYKLEQGGDVHETDQYGLKGLPELLCALDYVCAECAKNVR